MRLLLHIRTTNGTHRLAYEPSFASVIWGRLGHQLGSFLKDPWIVLGDVYPDVSNPNIIVYDFRTYKMNFIQNAQVKVDKTCLETQSRSKPNLSNTMDVLGRLTSKLLKT